MCGYFSMSFSGERHSTGPDKIYSEQSDDRTFFFFGTRKKGQDMHRNSADRGIKKERISSLSGPISLSD